MAIILNIDTAMEYGAVGLFENEVNMGSAESGFQKEHASFLQPAINKIMKEAGIPLNKIDAVAVTIGPGSYTGLRVGLAAAKGLCYALNKPLITVNTLEVMASAAIEQYSLANSVIHPGTFFCPMIDARRMEVFSAVYNADLHEISAPQALIVDENIYASLIEEHLLIFSGSGSVKLNNMLIHSNVSVLTGHHDISHLALLSSRYFSLHMFADTAYAVPFYLKAFYNPSIEKK